MLGLYRDDGKEEHGNYYIIIGYIFCYDRE